MTPSTLWDTVPISATLIKRWNRGSFQLLVDFYWVWYFLKFRNHEKNRRGGSVRFWCLSRWLLDRNLRVLLPTASLVAFLCSADRSTREWLLLTDSKHTPLIDLACRIPQNFPIANENRAKDPHPRSRTTNRSVLFFASEEENRTRSHIFQVRPVNLIVVWLITVCEINISSRERHQQYDQHVAHLPCGVSRPKRVAR